MRVRLSAESQRDISGQLAYLRGKTVSGMVAFRDITKRGLTLLKDQPGAGFTESAIPLRGARRIIVSGWYFDYDVIDDTVLVHRITSSINTPSLKYDDDFDYESDDDPSLPDTGSKRPS